MYPPLFRFNQSGESLFFDLINRKNGTTFKPEDLELGTPVASGKTCTKIPVTPAQPSPLTGTVHLTYDRLDLNSFFFGIPFNISSNELVDEERLSNEILNRWGIKIEHEDLQIERSGFGSYYPEKLSVSVKETSLCWVGSIDVWVLSEGNLLSLFTDNPLSYNDLSVKANGYIYSVDRGPLTLSNELLDYLTYEKILHTLDTESVNFLDYLSDITGDTWVIEDTRTPFNLKDAQVIYNGPFSETIEQSVVVIELGRLCSNLNSYLVLNLPTIDPEESSGG